MGFLDQLKSALDGTAPSAVDRPVSDTTGSGDLFSSLKDMISGKVDKAGGAGNLVGPAVVGGLLGALFSNNRGRRIAGNTALIGGGASLATYLWNKYKDRIMQAGGLSEKPENVTSDTVNEQATRLLRAMVFAARSDGIVDADEKNAIDQQIKDLKLGADAQRVIAQAMDEPIDPESLAGGVTSAQEAMQIYLASCAVIKVDNIMENDYIDRLATALNIPAEAKKDFKQAVQDQSHIS